jgi:hypothetical protein
MRANQLVGAVFGRESLMRLLSLFGGCSGGYASAQAAWLPDG